jgi:hypothetical protein
MRYISPKHRFTSNGLHDVIPQKTEITFKHSDYMLQGITKLKQEICRINSLFLHYSRENWANTLHTIQTQSYHHIGCYAAAPATILVGSRVVVEVRLGSVNLIISHFNCPQNVSHAVTTIFCEVSS